MNFKELSKKDIETLDELSDFVKKGIPISFVDAQIVIYYQEAMKQDKWYWFWRRFWDKILKKFN